MTRFAVVLTFDTGTVENALEFRDALEFVLPEVEGVKLADLTLHRDTRSGDRPTLSEPWIEVHDGES
jgi:hypothetical protein